MGEKILGWIEKIATGNNKKLFWTISTYVAAILLVTYPFIEASLFAPDRIEVRIKNLSDLLTLSNSSLSDSPSLQEEYDSILLELELARKNAAYGTKGTNYKKFEKNLKFFTGGILFFAIAIIALFEPIETKDKRLKYFLMNNLSICLICLLVAAFYGFIFSLIPTLGFVLINAILAPIASYYITDYWINKI